MVHNRREILRFCIEDILIYKQITRSVVCVVCGVFPRRMEKANIFIHHFYPENRLHTQCGWKKNVKIPIQIEYFSFILLKTNTAYNQNM